MLLLYCMHIHRLASYSVRLQEPLLVASLVVLEIMLIYLR